MDQEISCILNELDLRQLEVGSRENLNPYSILGSVPLERKRALTEQAAQIEILDRAMGSVCGMGVGDALGHPYEFLPAAQPGEPNSRFFDLSKLQFNNESNTFGLERGQWTDDASMGLCMADSLIAHRGFDGSDMRIRFWCWWNAGYNNAFRLDSSRSQSVGLGGNISSSLSSMRKGQKPTPRYEATGEDAGNGSLMRFAPIPVFFHGVPIADVCDYGRLSSYTTHPGIIAAEACAFLAYLISSALKRPSGPVDAKAFLNTAAEEYLVTSGLQSKSGWGYDEMKWLVTSKPARDTEKCWNWKSPNLDIRGTLEARGGRYNGYPVSAGYFGSYSMDGLAMALWAVYNTQTFDEAITKSVNLLGDADSHGSIAGQLAGALYGYNAINPQFRKWLHQWDEYEFPVRAVLLHKLGQNASASQSP
jgi:ADP-ribosyl-[dinitrogen reductase] hydrolase